MSKEPQRTLDKVKHLGSSREPWRGLDCLECFRVPKSAEGALECLECSESLIISQSGLKMSKESQRALESFRELLKSSEAQSAQNVPKSAECVLRHSPESSREPWRCLDCFRVPKGAEGALECLECLESFRISQSGLKMSKEKLTFSAVVKPQVFFNKTIGFPQVFL